MLMPALSVEGGPTLSGADLLLQGWQGMSRGVYAWLANPLFAVAFVAAWVSRRRMALVAAGASVLLALSSFAAEQQLLRQMDTVPELSLLPGFYVWLAALLVLFLLGCRPPSGAE